MSVHVHRDVVFPDKRDPWIDADHEGAGFTPEEPNDANPAMAQCSKNGYYVSSVQTPWSKVRITHIHIGLVGMLMASAAIAAPADKTPADKSLVI